MLGARWQNLEMAAERCIWLKDEACCSVSEASSSRVEQRWIHVVSQRGSGAAIDFVEEDVDGMEGFGRDKAAWEEGGTECEGDGEVGLRAEIAGRGVVTDNRSAVGLANAD